MAIPPPTPVTLSTMADIHQIEKAHNHHYFRDQPPKINLRVKIKIIVGFLQARSTTVIAVVVVVVVVVQILLLLPTTTTTTTVAYYDYYY